MLSKMLAAALIVMGAMLAFKSCEVNRLRAERTELIFERDSVVQINDSTIARLARTEIDKDSIQNELSAAKELNAKLVATARIRVTPDTVYRDSVEVVTVTDSVGRRVASIHDTTDVGVLDATITVEAPPDTTIGFDYVFAPSPIDLRISLLQTRENKAIFLATYSGGEIEVETPYAELVPPPKRLTWYIQGGYGTAWMLRGGVGLRLVGQFYLFSELDKRFNNKVLDVDTSNDVDFFFGFMKRF